MRPWAVDVPCGDVALDCDWPRVLCERHLRGAIVAQVGDREAHVDWHNHGDGSANVPRAPRVCYRLREGMPLVYAWGALAHEHLTTLARDVHALRMPGGQIVAVRGARLHLRTERANATIKTWHHYHLASPLFPPDVAWARRPRDAGVEREAWAGQLIGSGIRALLIEMGVEPRRVIHVHISGYKDVRVGWSRPEQGRAIRRRGFVAHIVTNARLPDGCAIGRHRSEGFGELRHA